MRTLILQMSIPLDGFIAGSADAPDWVLDDESKQYAVGVLILHSQPEHE